MKQPVIHALIPAAGSGSRFGGSTRKQYLLLAGRPILAHTIDIFIDVPEVAGITVVIAPDDEVFEQNIDTGQEGLQIVQGGDTRAESVLNGLHAIRRDFPDTGWVLVHDAARPCLPAKSLSRLFDEGLTHPDGGILAIPVRDTLKQSAIDGTVLRTVDRKHLWAAQTPQLFPLSALITAMETMLVAGEAPTDEAAAMEFVGAHPLLIPGSASNIKITWPEDMVIAEAWMESEYKAEKQ